jgi:NADH-quinone oxidoreductase subunit J
MLHAPMLGVLQVLIYAGAIMVLFLFVIMFLNPTATEPRRKLWWGFGSLAAILLAAALAAIFSNGGAPIDPVAATEIFGSPDMLGKSLFSDFVLPFEIASVLLLVAIVGAVVLAKREP